MGSSQGSLLGSGLLRIPEHAGSFLDSFHSGHGTFAGAVELWGLPETSADVFEVSAEDGRDFSCNTRERKYRHSHRYRSPMNPQLGSRSCCTT